MSFINLGEVDPLAQQIQAGTQAAQVGFDFFKSLFPPSSPPPANQPVVQQPQVITIPQVQQKASIDPKILMVGGGAAALIIIAMMMKNRKK